MRFTRLFKITDGEAAEQLRPAVPPRSLLAPPNGDQDLAACEVGRSRRRAADAGTVAARIRCAVLLHSCGRHDEARAAFDALLRDPLLGGSASVRPMVESHIYDTMRVCLEREGAFADALAPALLCYSCRGHFYRLQGRRRELAQLRSMACFDGQFEPLFRRAAALQLLPVARALVERSLQDVPDVDRSGLRTALEELGSRVSEPNIAIAQVADSMRSATVAAASHSNGPAARA